jgi:hypothetical protein
LQDFDGFLVIEDVLSFIQDRQNPIFDSLQLLLVDMRLQYELALLFLQVRFLLHHAQFEELVLQAALGDTEIDQCDLRSDLGSVVWIA